MIQICSIWSVENTQWNISNWKWSDCQEVTESAACLIWKNASVKWKDTLKHWGDWSNCSICYTWGNTDCQWKDADWKWSECRHQPEKVSIIIPGVEAEQLAQPWTSPIKNEPYVHIPEDIPWDAYKELKKKKKLVEVICKIGGKEFNTKVYLKDYKVNINGVKFVIDKKDAGVSMIVAENVHSIYR